MAYRKYSFRNSKTEELFNFMLMQRRGILRRNYHNTMKQADHLEWLRNFKQACLIYTMSLGSEQVLLEEANKVVAKYMKDLEIPQNVGGTIEKDVLLLSKTSTVSSNMVDLVIMCAVTANNWKWQTEIIEDRYALSIDCSIEILHGTDNSIVLALEAQRIA